MEIHARDIWFGLAILALAGQVLLADGLFVSLGIGCIAGAVGAWLDLEMVKQVALALAGFAIGWFAVRPWVMMFQYGADLGAVLDAVSLIGETGIVSEPIDPVSGSGHVTVNRQDWKAVALYDGVFAAGEKVEIVSVEGAKLFVKPVTR